MPAELRGGDGRYVKVSEVGTYLFCRRAWAFEREGTPSSREPERIAGTVYHVRHGERVAARERTGGLARAFLVLAIVLLILGLLVSLR